MFFEEPITFCLYQFFLLRITWSVKARLQFGIKLLAVKTKTSYSVCLSVLLLWLSSSSFFAVFARLYVTVFVFSQSIIRHPITGCWRWKRAWMWFTFGVRARPSDFYCSFLFDCINSPHRYWVPGLIWLISMTTPWALNVSCSPSVVVDNHRHSS